MTTTTPTPLTAPGMPDEVVTRTPVQDVSLPGGAGDEQEPVRDALEEAVDDVRHRHRRHDQAEALAVEQLGVAVHEGAIAVGHPLASSGVRLMTQLARQFEGHPEVRYGLTAMCIGIGMGAAVIWENPHHADYGKEVAA